MKILIAGGTGLLGSHSAQSMIEEGHEVHALTLPVNQNLHLPDQLILHTFNFMTAEATEIDSYMEGMDAFVFASGVDERVEFPSPVSKAYDKYNIEPMEKLLTSAKKMGVKKAIILGSYFAYFAKIWPQFNLSEHHPYIHNRLKQESVAFTYADDCFSIVVLELPYIFGIQKGRKPVWSLFIDRFEKPRIIFFPKGGTAMVTAHQVGVAIYHAILYGKSKTSYPLSMVNMTYNELVHHVLDAMHMKKKVINVPDWVAILGFKHMQKTYTKKGIEPGLNPKTFGKLFTQKLYIDPNLSSDLKIPKDDIINAIHESIAYAFELKKKDLSAHDMKDAL